MKCGSGSVLHLDGLHFQVHEVGRRRRLHCALVRTSLDLRKKVVKCQGKAKCQCQGKAVKCQGKAAKRQQRGSEEAEQQWRGSGEAVDRQ